MNLNNEDVFTLKLLLGILYDYAEREESLFRNEGKLEDASYFDCVMFQTSLMLKLLEGGEGDGE